MRGLGLAASRCVKCCKYHFEGRDGTVSSYGLRRPVDVEPSHLVTQLIGGSLCGLQGLDRDAIPTSPYAQLLQDPISLTIAALLTRLIDKTQSVIWLTNKIFTLVHIGLDVSVIEMWEDPGCSKQPLQP